MALLIISQKGDDNNKIIPLVYKAVEKVVLNKRVIQLEKQLGDKLSFDNIIGKSKTIQSAIESAKKQLPMQLSF
jgi:transcriptional regulator with PAS, ATPase and Fis domain